MDKEEIIRRRGVVAYKKKLQYNSDYGIHHREEGNIRKNEWRGRNPAKVATLNREINRKGGKYYEAKLKYNITGVQGERAQIRTKHAKYYRPFKRIIASASQLHHEWIPETASYMGLALVEKDQHMHGYIDVIQILEGEITLLSEEEIRMGANQ